MSEETEHRFLVRSEGWRRLAGPGADLRQVISAPVRYKLAQRDLTWEIDEYKGENRGLVIAEVEANGRLGKLSSWVKTSRSSISIFLSLPAKS
jgi:CYTH domain-containing protein